MTCTVKFLSSSAFGGEDENKIAYQKIGEKGTNARPGVIWCGGLKSDMEGSKAQALDQWASHMRRSYIRFDYFGHGASTGTFSKGTISRWAQDTVQIIDELTHGPQIIVGSSMGAWTALRAALARPDRVKGLLLIAPAPDFTEKLMWAGFSEDIRRTIMEEGIYYEPSDYDEPYEISRDLILDGRENLIMDAPLNFHGPVRILQGMKDASVPVSHAQSLMDVIASSDIEMTLVKNGDHSLSTPPDLRRLIRTLEELSDGVG
jgi:pimeloyl-ACP methyl ester carboxylesterase